MARGVRVNPFLSAGPVTPLIAAELRGKRELPRGEAARIARKLDCSRERVRQIMGKLGVRVAVSIRAFVDCRDCGRAIVANKAQLCAECRRERMMVELTCTACGKVFKRGRKAYNNFLRRIGDYKVGPWCKRNCGNPKKKMSCDWCGEEIQHRSPSVRGNHSFCGVPKRCDWEAAKLVQPSNWRLLGPDLLPMRENRAGITAFLGSHRLTGRGGTRRDQRQGESTPGARGTSRRPASRS